MVASESRAETIFFAALERSASAERERFVDESCAGDAELRRRVDRLLRAHPVVGSFLESAAPDVAAGLAAARAGAPTDVAGVVRVDLGTMTGPYKLLQQIGEGGMAVVYLAAQTQPIQRRVALKIIKPGMDSRQVIARFEAERQALALMDHPNIAKVLDAGTTDGDRPYFVMELVKGVPITRYCDECRLTPRQRLELFVQVCQAVQHAHTKGIVHRDLKPSNVLVAPYDGVPVPKVIDFGIAKATGKSLTEQTMFTAFGAVVGTPEYMSPEQAELNQLDVDTRSDVYSLGVLLYELLTGTTPLDCKRFKDAAVLETLRILREEDPPRPSTRLSTSEQLPSIAACRGLEPRKLSGLMKGELDWIVMKALEKDRRGYETASGLGRDVERYLLDESVEACPPSAAYWLRKVIRRHRGPVLAVSLVVLALMAGIIGTTSGLLRATAAQQDAVRETARKEQALHAAQQSDRARAEQLWHSLVAQARANRLSGRSGQRFDTLDTLRRATELAQSLGLPAERFHELRDAVTAALALPDIRLSGPWHPWPAQARLAVFDEAHATYARTDRDGGCSVRRVADDVEIHHLPGLRRAAQPIFSPDGKFLAIAFFDAGAKAIDVVHLWDLTGPAARRVLAEEHAGRFDFQQGGRFVLACHDGAIRVFELHGGRELRRLGPDVLRREVYVAAHPTENVVAVCSYFGSVVQVRDLGTGQVLASIPQTERAVSVAWHPDGRTLAVGYGESLHARLYDRDTLKAYRTLDVEGFGTYLSFNRAGDRLLTGNWGAVMEMFDVGTGQKLWTTTQTLANPRLSRDGTRLAGDVQDGRLGIWQIADGREYRTLSYGQMPQGGEFFAGAVSFDGRLVAFPVTNGVCLWDVATGGEVGFIPREGRAHQVLFEPSGSLLVSFPEGLSRWPVSLTSDAGGRARIGPPQSLPLPYGCALGQSRDGRVIVSCSRAVGLFKPHAGGWILHTDRPGQPIRLDPGADVSLHRRQPGRTVGSHLDASRQPVEGLGRGRRATDQAVRGRRRRVRLRTRISLLQSRRPLAAHGPGSRPTRLNRDVGTRPEGGPRRRIRTRRQDACPHADRRQHRTAGLDDEPPRGDARGPQPGSLQPTAVHARRHQADRADPEPQGHPRLGPAAHSTRAEGARSGLGLAGVPGAGGTRSGSWISPPRAVTKTTIGSTDGNATPRAGWVALPARRVATTPVIRVMRGAAVGGRRGPRRHQRRAGRRASARGRPPRARPSPPA